METLKELQSQVQRQKKLVSERDSLRRQIKELEQKCLTLKLASEREQADVDRLQKKGITALFYAMLGKQKEMLEKETREAYAAAAKYEAAEAELSQLRRDREAADLELAELFGSEDRYKQALQLRLQKLKSEDPVRGQRVLELEQQSSELQHHRNELREAINAGSVALSYARSVQSELDSAESWGTWDLLSNGGIITQMAKHDHLDEAQSKVQQLQRQLHRFKTELADVEIEAEIQAQVDGFLGFADWFFDGLFVDWAVQEHIHQAQEQMQKTVRRIENALNRLRTMETETSAAMDRIHWETERMALEEI